MSWRPLAGVTVGVLGSGRAVRFAGRTLAGLGAETTRVAPPGNDPPSASDPHQGGRSHRESRLTAWLDEGVTVVPTADAAEAAEFAQARLSAWDLLFHEAELQVPDLGAVSKAATTVAISLGSSGDSPACGLTAAARAGVAIAIGAPEREPLGLPFDLADYAAGLVAAVAGLHGMSQGASRVEVDAVSVLAAFAGVNGLVYEPYGIPWMRERRRASQCGGPYPYGFWRARDGHVCAIGRARTDWERLIAALGHPAWALDERFSNLRRNGSEHADELDALIEPWSSARTRAELLEIAQTFGLALAPVRTAAEVLRDPDLRSCGFLRHEDGTPVPGPPTIPAARAPEPPPVAAGGARRSMAGIRVLDFGWVWSAPLVAAGLAGMGADVVKVEHANRPDNSRLRGRPLAGWIERDDADSLEAVPYFLNLNQGKRSVALDLKDPQGAAHARRLLARADIVVENLSESAFRRLGLHYDDVSPDNEGLIWLSMATRRCGSQDMRGYAPTISSYSGLESAIGYPDDLTGMMTFGLCDPVAGSWGMLAILAAFRERERTGRGRLLRLGQLEGFLALLGEQLEEADREGATPPSGNLHPYFFPYGVFPTADGRHLAVAALDDEQRAGMARLLHTTIEPSTLERALQAYIAAKSVDEAVTTLRGTVACEPVLSYGEARSEPSLRADGMLSEVDHPLVGRHLVYTQPWRLDGARPRVPRPAPALGQHTAEVLRDWLGIGHAEQSSAPDDVSPR